MRINVYAEEITTETQWITKKLDDGRIFYGVRLYLKSAKELHDSPTDDDRMRGLSGRKNAD